MPKSEMIPFAVQVATYGVFFGVGYLLSPHIYDWNSTRQILKKTDLNRYFKKEKEYSQVVQRIGELTRCPEEATPSSVLVLLNDLRNSPFYHDGRCKPAYKNLWILSTRKDDKMNVEDLHQPSWLQGVLGAPRLECATGSCTKQELLEHLFNALANDSDNG